MLPQGHITDFNFDHGFKKHKYYFAMTQPSPQDILPLVRQPSRYLGNEINRVIKDLKNVDLRMALAFPDMYEIGTSHFGMQILYDRLNARADIAAERVFTPDVDMQTHLKAADLPLTSLESGLPLRRFDIIGFSLLYELNYTNILAMLDLARIPFYARERDDAYPMIIAGGPCTVNPEPVAKFFDAMVVGDGEDTIMAMADTWMAWKKDASDKNDLLQRWQQIEGVYIPSFFNATISDDGITRLVALNTEYSTVRRAILPDLDQTSFPVSPVVPYGRPVHDRLRMEISRGCTRGCRFCQAGMIYRPVRDRAPETILGLTEEGFATTGYDEISLLSLSTGDYRCIAPLLEELMTRHAADHRAVSFPSLRADTLTSNLVRLIKKVRKTGFTIAPEAGSQRLRDLINKNITLTDIEKSVQLVFEQGWNVIKLYFMIGLPTETQDDLKAIVDLVKHLRRIRPPKGGRRPGINVSITTFIPKAHTPFQWHSQISLTESRQKIEWLREELKPTRVRFKWQKPEVSWVEGLFSRGDRRLAHLLVTAYHRGCRFDGWSDHFDFDKWQAAFDEVNLDVDFFTTRKRSFEAPLPWDHIDVRLSQSFLQKEWERAIDGQMTIDCRDGKCHQCGVCDFKTIAPVVFTDAPEDRNLPVDGKKKPPLTYKKIRLTFTKTDDARYFGHLEMVNIFIRAFHRAQISLKFSQGFHPKPKISFTDSLPVGMESLNESLTIEVPSNTNLNAMINGLNGQLPAGLTVTGASRIQGRNRLSAPNIICYQIKLKEGQFDPLLMRAFIEKESWIHEKKTAKGKVIRIDAKEIVQEMTLSSDKQLTLCLHQKPGKSLRPPELIKNIFSLADKDIKLARIVKQQDNL